MGLVDELVPKGDLRAGAVAFARKVVAEKPAAEEGARPDDKVRRRATPELFAEFRKANAEAFRGFEAPEANIQCIEAAVNLPFDEGMKVERKRFMKLMTGIAVGRPSATSSSPSARPPRSPACPTDTPPRAGRRRSASSAPAPWAAASP